MRHRLGLATRTQISVCKSPFPSADTAVSLFRAKTVETVEIWITIADCNNATTRNVQAFVAADIRASRLAFITTAVVPSTLTIPLRSFYCWGTRSSSGTR